MTARFLSDEDISNIAAGRMDDPFSVLGFHRLGNRKGTAVVRAFNPFAKCVSVASDSLPGEIPMERLDKSGLFEAFVPESIGPYRFLVTDKEGARSVVEDAYRFPPVIGELDGHLLLEGRHGGLYDRLGAQLVSHMGVDGVSFALWAPDAYRVSVVGGFNRWDGRVHAMRRHPASGIWDIFIPGIGEGELYKFEIVARGGRLLPLKSDPYGFFHELRPKTASVVWNRKGYAWTPDEAWEEKKKSLHAPGSPVSIYEVHLPSWRRWEDGGPMSYRELARDLVQYAKWMGFTHLELMPVTEHPLDGSWGYQTTGMFAPTSRLGTPDDFKYFVESCHRAGLGVILDWVGAHFPKDAHGLAEFDGRPLYEYADPRMGEHRDWGTRVYDFSRSEVANFLSASAVFWLDEYRVDGLRFDAVASMLYLDYSRGPGQWLPNRFGGNENLEAADFCRRVNAEIRGRFPFAATFAEESAGWPKVTRPPEEGGLGFGYKWNMGWMHDSLGYMGKDPVHRRYHHFQMAHAASYAFSENFVLSISHDEVVHCKGSMINKMPGDEWQKFANLRAFYGYMWAFPGKKLLFMGDEFAQGSEWSEDLSLDWRSAENPFNRAVQRLVRDLNVLYASEPALRGGDSDPSSFEWINAGDEQNSIFSFVRRARDGGFLVVVANMTPIVREGYRIGVPSGGAFEEALNTDSFDYMGSGVSVGRVMSQKVECDGRPHSILVTVPPLALVVLRPVGNKRPGKRRS
jgi:1,4-alpha-glucan branching enzyme